jgi:RNA polymerase sigma-70 factor (ECF subfamily)
MREMAAALHTLSPGRADDAVVERALAERARTDRAAFAALYRRHVDAVYAMAYRRCGSKDVAEEATSATFERALTTITRFEWRDAGVRPWLLRIASNEVAEVYRKRARHDTPRAQLALREMADAHEQGTDDEPVRGADLARMHDALDRMNERYRAVITLRYLAGLSADHAAAELGCSNAMLAVTLHRALAALRREMERDPSKLSNGGAR